MAPGVDFTGSDMSDALMDRSVFVKANFTDAILARVVLTLSDLNDAVIGESVVYPLPAPLSVCLSVFDPNPFSSPLPLSFSVFAEGADFTDALLDKETQKKLCLTASGTNSVTGVSTRKSLKCGGSRAALRSSTPSRYMTDEEGSKPKVEYDPDRFSMYSTKPLPSD